MLSACGRKEELYEIPDLSQYKTDYVGDSSNVINIVSGQEYPEGYSYDSIQIQSETKPYGLTVFLKVEPSAVKIEDVVCAPSSRQLKKYRFFATQIMLGSIFMLP